MFSNSHPSICDFPLPSSTPLPYAINAFKSWHLQYIIILNLSVQNPTDLVELRALYDQLPWRRDVNLCHEDKWYIVDDLVGTERLEVGRQKLVDHVKRFGNFHCGWVRLRWRELGREGERARISQFWNLSSILYTEKHTTWRELSTSFSFHLGYTFWQRHRTGSQSSRTLQAMWYITYKKTKKDTHSLTKHCVCLLSRLTLMSNFLAPMPLEHRYTCRSNFDPSSSWPQLSSTWWPCWWRLCLPRSGDWGVEFRGGASESSAVYKYITHKIQRSYCGTCILVTVKGHMMISRVIPTYGLSLFQTVWQSQYQL